MFIDCGSEYVIAYLSSMDWNLSYIMPLGSYYYSMVLIVNLIFVINIRYL